MYTVDFPHGFPSTRNYEHACVHLPTSNVCDDAVVVRLLNSIRAFSVATVSWLSEFTFEHCDGSFPNHRL
jgi:hypothetical protein